MAIHSSIPAWRIPMYNGVWQATVHRVSKSQYTTSDLAAVSWISLSKRACGSLKVKINLYDKQMLAIVLNKITGSDFQDTYAIPL